MSSLYRTVFVLLIVLCLLPTVMSQIHIYLIERSLGVPPPVRDDGPWPIEKWMAANSDTELTTAQIHALNRSRNSIGSGYIVGRPTKRRIVWGWLVVGVVGSVYVLLGWRPRGTRIPHKVTRQAPMPTATPLSPPTSPSRSPQPTSRPPQPVSSRKKVELHYTGP